MFGFHSASDRTGITRRNAPTSPASARPRAFATKVAVVSARPVPCDEHFGRFSDERPRGALDRDPETPPILVREQTCAGVRRAITSYCAHRSACSSRAGGANARGARPVHAAAWASTFRS